MVYHDMASYLWVKGQTYYFNRRVPKDVQAHYKASRIILIKQSLKTLIVFRKSINSCCIVFMILACSYNFILRHRSDSYKFSEACNAQPKQQLQELGLRQLHKEETTYPSPYLAE